MAANRRAADRIRTGSAFILRVAVAAAAVAFLATASAQAASPTIRVLGKRLVDGAGRTVQLRGVNRAVFDSRCTYDATGDADGPVDQASIDAMRAWKINVVRVTLNEDCWLGINGLPKSGNSAAYRSAALTYVRLLRRNGLYVIVVPHFTAPGANPSTQIDNMPDAEHLPRLWTSLARLLAGDHGVIFEPINEVAMASWNNPHPNPSGQWACWLNGCVLDSVYGGRFQAAGLQTLVNAIRSQGATQPILLGGIDFNADLTQLLSHLPRDPRTQLVASPHIYDFVEGKAVDAMFKSPLEGIAKRMPVVVGELGERNCNSGTAAYTKHVLSLIDGEAAKGLTFGVLGWTWNARTAASTGWTCPTGPDGEGGPLMIRNYAGSPTVMGGAFRSWFKAKAGTP